MAHAIHSLAGRGASKTWSVPDLGASPTNGPRELRRRVRQPRGEHADQLERGVRVLADDPAEQLLRDLQRLELGLRGGGGGARHVAEDRDLADDVVAPERVDDDRSGGGGHADLDLA